MLARDSPDQAATSSSTTPGAMTRPVDERVIRRGRVSWIGHPPAGVARVDVQRNPDLDSADFVAVPVALSEGNPGADELTPGELLAVAYGAALASALAESLALGGSPAQEIVVESACTFQRSAPRPCAERARFLGFGTGAWSGRRGVS